MARKQLEVDVIPLTQSFIFKANVGQAIISSINQYLDEILAVPGYEVLLVGPTDLSASLGVNGDIHNSKVENIMSDVAQRIKGSGKYLSTTFGDVEDCRRWIGEGYQMMNVSSTLALGTIQTKQIFSELREQFKVKCFSDKKLRRYKCLGFLVGS